jgi:hypothetical protein
LKERENRVYIIYPFICRQSASKIEAAVEQPGDHIVQHSTTGYTLAKTIKSPCSKIWRWLIQMGQGRGGFYTHEWVENLMGANIHNADSILPQFQKLSKGDSIRLTPDPYFGKPGQYLVVAQVDSPHTLVFKQILPNGSLGSWAYVLKSSDDNSTRLIFRRRGSQPSLFDKIAMPGYYFMDMGMMRGIKERAEK